MKKTVSIILTVLLLTLSFAGCGGTKLSRGVWDGNNFNNESTGVKLTITDDWTITSDEDLAELMNTTVQEMAEGNAFSEAVMKMQNIYDCMVTSPSNSNISILYENLSMSGSKNISESEYLDILKESIPDQVGVDCDFSDYSERTLNGNTYAELCVSIADYGISQYYFCRKLDNYMISIIVSVMPDDDAEAIIACLE